MFIWVIILSVGTAGLVFLFQSMAKDFCWDWDEKKERRQAIIPAVCIITFGIILGITLMNDSLNRHADKFEISKSLIESSFADDIEGVERLGLIQLADDHNRDLAERQRAITVWYNFGHFPSVRNRYLALQPIRR